MEHWDISQKAEDEGWDWENLPIAGKALYYIPRPGKNKVGDTCVSKWICARHTPNSSSYRNTQLLEFLIAAILEYSLWSRWHKFKSNLNISVEFLFEREKDSEREFKSFDYIKWALLSLKTPLTHTYSLVMSLWEARIMSSPRDKEKLY